MIFIIAGMSGHHWFGLEVIGDHHVRSHGFKDDCHLSRLRWRVSQVAQVHAPGRLVDTQATHDNLP